MDKESDGSGCCSCCCGATAGLAIGYMLQHGPDSLTIGELLREKTSAITVNTEDDGFLVRNIRRYQTEIGPYLKETLGVERICRYEPSCSEYALRSIKSHGKIMGPLRAAVRIARCNPLSKGGYDPV